MRVTLEYIKQKFDEFNNLIFEGKLQPLPFKTTNARSFMGQVSFYREKNEDGTWHYCNFQFLISTTVDVPESEVEDIIIHEMIHYYILSNQMQDNAPHGDLFMRKMQEINVKFNRNISVAHKGTKEEADSDTEIRQHIVCVTRLNTNQTGVTIATKTNLFRLWDEIPKIPNVAECTWYVTTDPYFNRYPRANSAKIYSAIGQEILEHLTNAQKLIRTGNTIRIEK